MTECLRQPVDITSVPSPQSQPPMRQFLVSLVLALLAGSTSLAAQSTPITIRAGHLLDGRGGSTRNTTIIVTGTKISAVGASKATTVTYDLSRYTVLPGLIDGHDHVGWYFNKAGRFHSGNDGEIPADETLAAAGNAYTTLVAGWTTIASPGSPAAA